MNLWEAVLLGIVQGLTEFFPVSSSGHLVIAQGYIEGFRQPGVLFDVMVHFGTLVAIVFFLRSEVAAILRSLLPGSADPPGAEEMVPVRRRIALYIVAGTACTVAIALLFENRVHHLFASAGTAAAMLLVTGLLLFLADRVKGAERREGDLTLADGVIVGIVQGIALIPGISRSGATIAAGMFRKVKGETAARFSFLMSIPAVAGAMVYESRYVGAVPAGELGIYFAGAVVAAITGFLTLRVLFFIIKAQKLRVFAYYCWFVGITTLVLRTVAHG